MANVEQFPMTEAKNSILHGGHCICPGFCLATTPPPPPQKEQEIKSRPRQYKGQGDRVHFTSSFPSGMQYEFHTGGGWLLTQL